MNFVSAYTEWIGTTARVTANVQGDQLDDPTPCPEFDVRALINHFIDGLHLFAGIATGDVDRSEVATLASPNREVTDFVSEAGDDPSAAVVPPAEKARTEWRRPDLVDQLSNAGEAGSGLIVVALAEAVIHGWDIARATAQPYEIPDEIAGPVLEWMRAQMGGGERPPGMAFASEVTAPAGASLGDRLIAFSGRTP